MRRPAPGSRPPRGCAAPTSRWPPQLARPGVDHRHDVGGPGRHVHLRQRAAHEQQRDREGEVRRERRPGRGRRLAGRCVNTIVLISPIRSAIQARQRSRTAPRARPVQKKMAPVAASERPKRSNSHSASSDWTTKPPAKASRLNSAASVSTMRRERPSGCAGDRRDRWSPQPGQAAIEEQREPAQRGVEQERRLERRLQRRPQSSPASRAGRRQARPRAAAIDADEAVAGEERGAVTVTSPCGRAAPARAAGTR